jgi:hypothetical protein
MSFQATDPTTNAPVGMPNELAAIEAGGSQSFVLSFSATEGLAAAGLAPEFFCRAVSPAAFADGVNSIDLRFADGPVTDIIALAATVSPGLTLHIGSGPGAFAVATIDAGAPGAITAVVDTGTAALPIQLSLCETDPASGHCLAPPASSVPVAYTAGATPTFSVFATATGPIAFAPAAARVFVRFQDQGGVSHGTTSVAVTTD